MVPQLTPAPVPGTGSRAALRIGLAGRADELTAEGERVLRQFGNVVRRPDVPAAELGTACGDGVDLVVRLDQEQPQFVSNAGERNTLLIYEAVIVVGLPVTLISAAAWPWYGEFSGKGAIETWWCASGARATTKALASVRAKGRGFIGPDRLRNELEPQMRIALARKLVGAAADCGRLQMGGDKCRE